MRPRPDDRHVSLQDVDELWQFIDVGSTQDSTNACHARVVLYSLRDLISVLLRRGHRPEFQHSNWLAIKPVAFLAEEDWPARINLYCDRNEQEERRQNNQADSRGKEVK